MISRFLVVGTVTVGVDLIAYRTLLLAGLGLSLAKAVGFLCGTIFAFVSNRRITFQSNVNNGRIFIFSALYTATLGINVAINRIMINLLGEHGISMMVAFLAATTVSATLNFLGMRHLVFSDTAAPKTGRS